jgi:hypothetical protein
LEECTINFDDDGMDGAECADGSESANDAREQVSVGLYRDRTVRIEGWNTNC